MSSEEWQKQHKDKNLSDHLEYPTEGKHDF